MLLYGCHFTGVPDENFTHHLWLNRIPLAAPSDSHGAMGAVKESFVVRAGAPEPHAMMPRYAKEKFILAARP